MYLWSRNQYMNFQYIICHFSMFWLTVNGGIAEWKWKQILNQHFYPNKYQKALLKEREKGSFKDFLFILVLILPSFSLLVYISPWVSIYIMELKQEKKVQLKKKKSAAILSKGLLSVNYSSFQSFTRYNNEKNFCKFFSESPPIPERMLWTSKIELEVRTVSSGPEINLPNPSWTKPNLPDLLFHWQFSLKERYNFKVFFSNMKRETLMNPF